MARRPLYPIATLLCLAVALPASASANTLDASGGHDYAEPSSPKEALSNARLAKQGKLVDGKRVDVTLALKSLVNSYDDLSGADKRRAKRLLARPTIGDTQDGDTAQYQAGTTERSFCSSHFCVHWVDTTADAPSLTDTGGTPGVPDYVEIMSQTFENVYNVENIQMGWKTPKADFGKGGDDRTDVYIADIGGQSIFGYASADADQRGATTNPNSLASYLVMDDDYSQSQFSRYPNFLPPLQVTAAHEYNHVLQYNYDALQDLWMFESTAVWMEDKVYDDINDYRSYLDPWSKESLVPVTQASSGDGGANIRVYGDVVWNRWIDEKIDPTVIRRAWELSLSTSPKSFAPLAYDRALREKGTNFNAAFGAFASETSEWRALPSGFFEEGENFPDMRRATVGDGQPFNLTPGDNTGVDGTLNHTAYVLVNVDPQGQNQLRFVGTLPKNTAGSISIVGRTGTDTGGQATIVRAELPKGGRGTVTLENAGQYARVTAVIVNTDFRSDGFSRELRDWNWSHDNESISLALNDDVAPKLAAVAPKRNAKGVSTKSRVRLTFSEYVKGITARTVKITGPGGKTVKAKVSIADDEDNSRNVVFLKPTKRLAAGTKYTVKLGSITDAAGNKIPSRQKTYKFTTAR